MNINTLGLLNQMSHIVNEEIETSDYVITKYILNNIKEIDDITINSIVDNVYVSRSSVRRYAMRLGFDNFSEFKNSFSDIAYPSNIHLRPFYNLDDHREHLNSGIMTMFKELDAVITTEIIQNFCDDIRNYENVFIMCANNTAGNMAKFQQELMYVSKLIKIVSSNFDEEFTNSTSFKDNLIIVVSISGVFSSAMRDYINDINGKKILITANRKEELRYDYNEIIYISSRDIVEDTLGLLGKYGLTYFFDIVSQYYIYESLKED